MKPPMAINSHAPCWWALKSRPRCEKKISALLQEQDKPVFLPCRTSRRDYQSKSVTFTVPLFPGYVFAYFCPTQKTSVLARTPSSGIIEITDQQTFIRQVNTLKTLLEHTQEVKSCPFIDKGKLVRITSGKFKGLEGIVRRYSRKKRLILSLDLLQQSIEVELSAEMVVLAA